MLYYISRIIQFIFGALLPLQITFEVIHLSKDWPFPMLKTASYALQQQVEKVSLQMLLLKYWALYGLVYLIIPNSPFYFLCNFVPFDSIILTVLQLIAFSEIVRQYIRFIEEQDKIIALLQNLDGESKTKFQILSNIIFTTININNKDYIATSFLFGDYSKMLIMYVRTLLFPETDYINISFRYIEKGITTVKKYLQKEAQENYFKTHHNDYKGFKWESKPNEFTFTAENTTEEGGDSTEREDSTESNKTSSSSPPPPSAGQTAFESVNRFWNSFKTEYSKASSRNHGNFTGSESNGSSGSSTNRKNPTPDDYEIIDNDLD
ncbi:autophagy-related protein 40 [Monosporozyma unispora]|nr:hypothetical protein C6P44_001709 [Kazachstania unispora]